MRLSFQHNGNLVTLNAEPDGDGWRVRLPDGAEHRLVVHRLPNDILQITTLPISPLEESSQEDKETRRGGGQSKIQNPKSKIPTPDTRHPTPTPHVFRVPFARTERGLAFSSGGQVFTFTEATERQGVGKRRAASGMLTAPMVGLVADVMVEEGQTVEAYQPLVVIEAMKVMATLDAPFAGIVRRVYVEKSERVAHGAPIIEIVPAAENEP